MQNLAPIALFVYNRPEHTRRTISYLQKNLLAEESRLFIFADGPKTSADKAKVDEVRQLLKEVTGFKSVKVIARDENSPKSSADNWFNGLENNRLFPSSRSIISGLPSM